MGLGGRRLQQLQALVLLPELLTEPGDFVVFRAHLLFMLALHRSHFLLHCLMNRRRCAALPMLHPEFGDFHRTSQSLDLGIMWFSFGTKSKLQPVTHLFSREQPSWRAQDASRHLHQRRVNNAPRTAILARALRSSLCAPVFMGLGSAILSFNGRETAATRRHGLPGHGSSLLRCGFAVLSFLASNFPQRYQGDFTQPCIFGTEFTCTRVEFTPALLGPSEPGWFRIHPTLLHRPEAQASRIPRPNGTDQKV